jgi:hypothetical protein
MEIRMDGRAFLASARLLLTVPSQENWRSAVNRSYYALLHEGQVALERWGFPLPPRESIHSFVRLRFTMRVNTDLRVIGDALDGLNSLRIRADYRLGTSAPFTTDTAAVQAVNDAQAGIAQLDAIEADAARRAAAVAAITAAWPTAAGS